MQGLNAIWKKIEKPVVLLVILLAVVFTVLGVIGFDTSHISKQALEKLYTTKFVNVELFGLLIGLTRNLVIWLAITILGKNIILAAIMLILLPRLATLPFSNKMTLVAAKQGLLKPEFLKLKKYYSKASEDKEVNAMYMQDSQRLSKKFAISATENMGSTFISLIPVLLVSFAISPLVNDLKLNVHGLSSWGIDITKPFIPVALFMVILMALQLIIPLENATGPTADQQKQMVFMMPLIFGFVFINQPVLIPIVWLVTYLISLVQTAYFHKFKKFSRKEVLNRD